MNKISKTLNTTNIRLKYTKLLAVFSFVFVFFSVCGAAEAATLYLSPSTGSYKIGQSFTVNVFVSSAEQAMNAAQGTISFPADKLSVASISKSGSIVSLWTQEPSFSAGTVSFEGIVLNPGFTGSAGKMISINFTTRAAGDAVVSFSSGSVLANDGEGTNILSGFGNARFNIESENQALPAPISTTPASSAKTPPAPMIYSSTHPDPNKWYNISNPRFSWSLAEDITGVSFLINDKPLSNPGPASDGLISEKQFENNIEDGIWYFHLCLKNSRGWGAISHFRFNIDARVPADFTINFSSKEELLKDGLKAKFSANDDLSGINRFEVKIDNYEMMLFPDSESKTYDLPVLDPGKHNVAVKVFDNAGNFTADFKEIKIEALDPPEIKEYSSELTTNSFLVVKGSTYPNASLEIWIQKNTEMPVSHKMNTDEYGNFVFIDEHKSEVGVYKLWIEAVNELGFKTEKSKEIFISVQESNLSKLKAVVTDLMVIVSILISSVLFLAFFVLFMIKKIKLSKRKLRKEVHEAEDSLEKAFSALYEDMAEQLESLEKIGSKRELTKEEEKIKKKFKDNLKIAENFIRKEIEDIEKEI